MRLRHAKTLITGKPGVGKTTMVQKIIKRMGSVNMAGFCTSEIRCTGSHLGFELQGLNGGRRTLAHMDIDSRHRVGRYGVDKDGFEEFLATLDLLNADVELIVIDEIGKMELFSNRFRNLVCDALNADKQVLATIPLKGNDFIRGIKKRLDIRLLEVTHANRNRLPEAILEGVSANHC
ncbi:MAG: NTPase [Desulfobacterales bacterium]